MINQKKQKEKINTVEFLALLILANLNNVYQTVYNHFADAPSRILILFFIFNYTQK